MNQLGLLFMVTRLCRSSVVQVLMSVSTWTWARPGGHGHQHWDWSFLLSPVMLMFTCWCLLLINSSVCERGRRLVSGQHLNTTSPTLGHFKTFDFTVFGGKRWFIRVWVVPSGGGGERLRMVGCSWGGGGGGPGGCALGPSAGSGLLLLRFSGASLGAGVEPVTLAVPALWQDPWAIRAPSTLEPLTTKISSWMEAGSSSKLWTTGTGVGWNPQPSSRSNLTGLITWSELMSCVAAGQSEAGSEQGEAWINELLKTAGRAQS